MESGHQKSDLAHKLDGERRATSAMRAAELKGEQSTSQKDFKMKQPAVYILASQKDGTLYVGVTSNLPQRIWQHKNHQADGFANKYNVTTLVYFEQAESMASAIAREKALKKCLRAAKINLIETNNPAWLDLYEAII